MDFFFISNAILLILIHINQDQQKQHEIPKIMYSKLDCNEVWKTTIISITNLKINSFINIQYHL